MAAEKASTGKRPRSKRPSTRTSSLGAEELTLPHKQHQGLLTEQQRKDYEEFTRLHTVHQGLLTEQQRKMYQAMLARHVHQQYQAWLTLQEQRRRLEQGLRETPHLGAKRTIWNLRCDAPRGCPACIARAKIFSERSSQALEHASNNFNHAVAQLETYSHYLKAKNGRDLSRLKGDRTHQRIIKSALAAFGEESELPYRTLLRALRKNLGDLSERRIRNPISARQISRHVKDPKTVATLGQNGKKIV